MRVRWGRIVVAVVLLGAVCGLVSVFVWQLPIASQITSLPDGIGGVRDRATERAAAPGRASTSPPRESNGPAVAPYAGSAPVAGDLTPFNVLTLQYTPYMATLALMDAKGYMEASGYDLRLHDVYATDGGLDEAGQCAALQGGGYDALATTVDATRKCGADVAIGIPIGQSAGNDAIVVKPGVETWNDVFEHAVAFTGYSVSEYMACFASHTANAPLQQPVRFDDAAGAVDAWINAGAEQNIQSVVAWEPEVSRALAAVPDSRVILSSRDVRILWDVVEFSTVRAAADPQAFTVFTRAYYRALLDLTRDPDGALAEITAWAAGDDARSALVTTDDPAAFKADLDREAFATLRDAAFLMDDRKTLVNRLDEAVFYWQYCGVDVPEVADVQTLIAPEFALAAREDSALLGGPNERPSAEVFQITDFTNSAAVTDAQIEQGRVLFSTGVVIEFVPNRTDFLDPVAASTTLENAVRFLRTCQDCVLEVQGGAAYPGERVCPGCRKEDSDQLAVDRGQRVYEELKARFDVPEAQLRSLSAPHAPQFAGSNTESELRQDRRTFLTGYQLSGR
jgi:hypothetical protein